MAKTLGPSHKESTLEMAHREMTSFGGHFRVVFPSHFRVVFVSRSASTAYTGKNQHQDGCLRYGRARWSNICVVVFRDGRPPPSPLRRTNRRSDSLSHFRIEIPQVEVAVMDLVVELTAGCRSLLLFDSMRERVVTESIGSESFHLEFN